MSKAGRSEVPGRTDEWSMNSKEPTLIKPFEDHNANVLNTAMLNSMGDRERARHCIIGQLIDHRASGVPASFFPNSSYQHLGDVLQAELLTFTFSQNGRLS